MLQDRYRGVLLGLAVGDALGGPVEFLSPEEIVHRYGGPLREMVGGGWLYLRPGETTDDTACARCIAESIAACGDIDIEDIGRRFVDWTHTLPKDIGTITRYALLAWAQGMRGSEAARHAHDALGGQSAGNGSLMRAAPLALRYVGDDAAIVTASRDVARITHYDPQAWTSDVLLNLTIARLLRGMGPAEAVAEALERVEREPGAAPEVPAAVARALQRRDSQGLGTSGYVIHTLEAAVWLLVTGTSFEQALITAVNLGGDADTIAAVCGALCGARWGASAIPRRWLDILEGRTDLERLADDLLALAR